MPKIIPSEDFCLRLLRIYDWRLQTFTYSRDLIVTDKHGNTIARASSFDVLEEQILRFFAARHALTGDESNAC